MTGCPAEDVLAAFSDGALAEDGREVVARHLDACARCRALVGRLGRLAETPPPPGVPSDLLARATRLGLQRRRAGALSRAAGLSLAATVLLAAGLWMPRPARHAPPSTPAAGVPDAVRSVPAVEPPRLFEPAADRPTPAADIVFRWSAVSRAVFYDLRVTTGGGDLVWSASTTETTVPLDRAVRLERGVRYYSWVSAQLPEGQRLQSNIVELRIEP